MNASVLVALALGLAPATGSAAPPAESATGTDPRDTGPASARALRLDEVLAAVDAQHPKLEAADRKVEAAEGRRFSARGVWDPTLDVRAKWLGVGYYRNTQLDAAVRQATPAWGLGLYAGYRLGVGEFPVYKGEEETLSSGEVRAGVELPLWKGGPIDPGRAELQRSDLLAEAVRCERGSTQLEVRRKAANAYWKWVEAGQEVKIQRELLEVAEVRQTALEERMALGAVPQFAVLDNERLVLDRQGKLVSAQRDFAELAVALSLFLRDSGGTPVVVDEARVPARVAGLAAPQMPQANEDIEGALSLRPELCELRRAKRAAEVDVRLARNERAPDIRAQAFVAKDLGGGPPELAPVDLGIGASLTLPLALRKARGKLMEARAKAAKIDADLRGLTDRVAAEVKVARVDLDAAFKQLELAYRQVEVAVALAEAERTKFDEGASDLVIVNLRELAAADAAGLQVEAFGRYQRALADYLAATGRGR